MKHLTETEFWELMHGNIKAEKTKFMQHIAECPDCHSSYRLLQQIDLEYKTAPDVPSEFSLRVASKVRHAEIEWVFLRPWFRVFRYALISSTVLCLVIIIGLVAGYEGQVPMISWSAFSSQLSPKYITAALGLFAVWLADRYWLSRKDADSSGLI